MSLLSNVTLTLLCLCLVFFMVSEGRTTERSTAGTSDFDERSRKIKAFVVSYFSKAQRRYENYAKSNWDYQTNMTEHNLNILNHKQSIWENFLSESAMNASLLDTEGMTRRLKSMVAGIQNIGFAAQRNQTKLDRLNALKDSMEAMYVSAEGCLNETRSSCLSYLELLPMMRSARDYQHRLKAWTGWRTAMRPLKSLYSEFVDLGNEAMQLNGFTDMGDSWRASYDRNHFERIVRQLYRELRPLYVELHAYVRRKLKSIYGAKNFPRSGHIPANILGEMFSYDWSNLIEELKPYPDAPSFDVTNEMIRKNYTVLKMFQMAEEFFKSLGLKEMPDSFWKNSMFEKPTDGRIVNCQQAAADFRNGRDYRIRMCTTVSMSDFNIVHHEMGHIHYYMSYSRQHWMYRDGANPGFQEAVGDTIALSVNTPNHMFNIGLLSEPFNDYKSDVNYLMLVALNKIAMLPVAFLVDQWRWNVFRGDITPENYNKEWWNLKCKYQGVYPPVSRSSIDFDPASLFHVAGHYEVMGYFISFVLQFQFHKGLCIEAGYDGPLHKCDIYNSKKAGKKLIDMLKLGSSEPWEKALKIMTNKREMDARPMVEYFKPLMDFLQEANRNDTVDWRSPCPRNND